jgi:hypothetical protein
VREVGAGLSRETGSRKRDKQETGTAD